MGTSKYILVLRTEEYNPIAMSRETYADIDNTPFYDTTIEDPQPVTMSRIRKERIRVYSDEEHKQYIQDCAEQDAWDTFRNKYHDKTFKATVRWFDNTSGEGAVTIDEDLTLTIYACNIKGRKTWYPHTACIYYSPGQIVDIKVDCHSRRTLFAIGETEGTFDSEGWDRIKDKNLAFRCDSDGSAITGLLGSAT